MDGGLSTCQSIVLSIYRANGSDGSTTWRLTNLSIHLSTQLIFYTFTDRILFYFILFYSVVDIMCSICLLIDQIFYLLDNSNISFIRRSIILSIDVVWYMFPLIDEQNWLIWQNILSIWSNGYRVGQFDYFIQLPILFKLLLLITSYKLSIVSNSTGWMSSATIIQLKLLITVSLPSYD